MVKAKLRNKNKNKVRDELWELRMTLAKNLKNLTSEEIVLIEQKIKESGKTYINSEINARFEKNNEEGEKIK